MYILFSFSNKDNYFGLMGVHIRASFTGCAIVTLYMASHKDHAKQCKATMQCTNFILSSGCGLGRGYAAMISDWKWLQNQPVSDMLKVYTIYDDAHGFIIQHFTSSSAIHHTQVGSKAIHYTPVGFFKQCATPKVMLTHGATLAMYCNSSSQKGHLLPEFQHA